MLHLIDLFPTPETPGALPVKRLGEQPHIHPTARVRNSYLGAWTNIGRSAIYWRRRWATIVT
jgi:hypothetical protein